MALTPNCILPTLAGAKLGPLTVQVIDVKKVSANPQQERYRATVSDGTYYIAAMFATSLNHLVTESLVLPYSIIRVNELNVNNLQGRCLLIMLAVDVVSGPVAPIGTPQAAPTPGQGAGADAGSAAGGGQPAGMANPYGTAAPAYMPAPPQQPVGMPHSGMGGYSAAGGGFFGAGSPTGAIVRNPDAIGQTLVPLIHMSPYKNKWAIKVRVTAKGDIKSWNKPTGSGKLFSVDLLDDQGVEIRATFFKDGVDKFYDLIQPDHVYIMSGGRVQPSKKQFTSIRHEYEISFDEKSTVSPCSDDARIARIMYNFVKLDQLLLVDVNKTVDVIGIVRDPGNPTSLTSKTGKELVKRDVLILDDSGGETGTGVTITLWGDKSNMDIAQNAIMAFKGAKVSEYNGRSLSTWSSSTIEVNPDVPDAHRLRGWLSSKGGDAGSVDMHNLTERGGGSGGGGDGPLTRVEMRYPVQILREQTLGHSEKGDLVIIKATVCSIKHDEPGRMWYPACTTNIDGRTCNKKVVENGDGTASCERCGPQSSFEYRYILSVTLQDQTGSAYVTLFNEEARTLLGHDATSLQRELVAVGNDTSSGQFTSIFASQLWKEYLFTIRVKMEALRDEQRLKTTVVKFRALDYVKESKALLEGIKKFSLQ